MGIDCEFRASHVTDVDSVAALSGVHKVFRPGEFGFVPKDRWVIATMIRLVGLTDHWTGYAPGDRGPKIATLIRALQPYCRDLEYGGDNGVWFVPVTNEVILEIERAQ